MKFGSGRPERVLPKQVDIGPLSLFVKPASAFCNLACSYCFYIPKLANGILDGPAATRMSKRMLAEMTRQYLEIERRASAPALLRVPWSKPNCRRWGVCFHAVTSILALMGEERH